MSLNGKTSGWTDERIETLKAMWAAGDSAAIIAAEMGGGLTRSAVIGKVHRLKLSARHTKRQSSAFGAYSLGKPRQKRERLFVPPPPDLVLEFNKTELCELTPEQHAKSVRFMDLSRTTCRWPYGSPREAGFVFCGHTVVAESPYCGLHTALAYLPLKKRETAA